MKIFRGMTKSNAELQLCHDAECSLVKKQANKHNTSHPHHFHPIQSGRILIAVHTDAKARFKAKIKQNKTNKQRKKKNNSNMSSLSKILKLVFVALKFNTMRIAVEDHLNARNNLVFQFSVADSHSVKSVFSTHFACVKGY